MFNVLIYFSLMILGYQNTYIEGTVTEVLEANAIIITLENRNKYRIILHKTEINQVK